MRSVNMQAMQDDTFNTINAAWNQIRVSGAPDIKAVVSGLVDPRRIMLQRVGESATTITLMFKGFDQALNNSDDVPLLKRLLFDWIRKFAEAQIVRGSDDSSFSIMLRKPQQSAQPQPTPMPQTPMESVRRGPLVHISSVRKVDG